MMKEIGKPEKAKAWIENALDKKKVVMGFGHRVYRTGDSRVPTMKHYMFKVAKLLKKEKYTRIYEILEKVMIDKKKIYPNVCLLYTSPSPRDATLSRMPSSA